LLAEVDQVVAVSAADAMALEVAASSFGVYNHAPLSVVGNGVDLEYFRPYWDGRDDSTIVISGKMSYHANVTAVKYLAQEVMPSVWSSRPDARLIIVGADPPGAVRSLQNSLPNESPSVGRRIAVTGRVEDIRPYLWKASVCVAPIVYGAGVQNKVLEAMSCGAPVVASPQAVSTLQCSNGRHVLIGNNADELATHILNVLGNRSLRDRLSRAGRDFVERYHTWEESIRVLERVYLDALESTQRNKSAPAHLVRQA
jgi:glycosyltransferase involved in cell wall biosynthesis